MWYGNTNFLNYKELYNEHSEEIEKIWYLFICPSIGEPSDNSSFKFLRHSSKSHVLFHAVHAILKLYSGHIHVADHTTDIPHDRCKN